MKTFVINLDRHADRWTWMRSQLGALGIEAERFAAIEGPPLASLGADVFSPQRERAHGGLLLGPGGVGCYLSHLNLWRWLAAGTDDWCLILEDDAELTADLPKFLETMGRAPARWEVILLTPETGKVPLYRHKMGGPSDLIRYGRPGVYASAYLIHKRAVQRMLHHMLPIAWAIDDWRAWYLWHGLVVYRTASPLAHHTGRFGSSTRRQAGGVRVASRDLIPTDRVRRVVHRATARLLGIARPAETLIRHWSPRRLFGPSRLSGRFRARAVAPAGSQGS